MHLLLTPIGSAEAVSISAGSGTEALDAEALAQIARVEPLPVTDGAAETVEITVPLQFAMRWSLIRLDQRRPLRGRGAS